MTRSMQSPALSGAAAMVTGANRGLGRAIALDLARAGADVALCVRDAGSARHVAAEIEGYGRRTAVIECDVVDLAQGRRAVAEAADKLGALDILVNNAGGGIGGPALDVTPEDFDAVWALNTRSVFFLAQTAARLMARSGGGSIINIASQAGLVALPGESSYCISKAAVIHMTRVLAVEWGELGIRVNAVAPTFIETDGTAEALGDPDFRADVVERIAALHRIGDPQEVAGAVTFLASSSASLITGVTLPIDGGWTAR